MNRHPLLPSQIDPESAVRLVCLSHAGGGAAAFFRWRRYLPPEIGLVPLRLPGREDRSDEPAYTHLLTLAQDAVDALVTLANRPFALLGHSLGAYAAWEIARELRRRNLRLPEFLAVSASPAPHLARLQPPLGHLPDDQFIDEIVRRFDGIPESIRADPSMLKFMLSNLRADFNMLEEYDPPDEPPLDLEILALGGADDPGVSITQLQAWRGYTTERFSARLFPGGHFFLFREQEDRAAMPNLFGLQMIVDRLRKVVETQ